MALIYVDAEREIDLLQLADELGVGVNIGATDAARFVSADVDDEVLIAAVEAHVPDEQAIADREAQAQAELEAARAEREAQAAAREAAHASARTKLKKLGLTDEEIEALRS